MLIAIAIFASIAMIASAVALWLVYQATKKITISKTVPCHKCNRLVIVYSGEVEGPKECHQCQIRRR